MTLLERVECTLDLLQNRFPALRNLVLHSAYKNPQRIVGPETDSEIVGKAVLVTPSYKTPHVVSAV
jgi:hypothetical protein